MVDNQHRKISGYRELTVEEITLMNEIKDLEARWNGLADRLRELPDIDQRQLSISITAGEDAFMRAVRAVARPQRISRQVNVETIQGILDEFDGLTNNEETRKAVADRLLKAL